MVGCGSKSDNKTAEKQTEKKDDKKIIKLNEMGKLLLEEQKKVLLLYDVRVADQYKEGHIKDAINPSLETIEKDIASKVPKKIQKLFYIAILETEADKHSKN